MFDELQRTLRRLEGEHRVSIEIPSDDDGYLDRECPSPDCQFIFKINDDDWKDKVNDEMVFCPFCGHIADSNSWWTQDQIQQAKDVALDGVKDRLNRAMVRDAEKFNRRQPRGGLVNMKMEVRNRSRPPIRKIYSETMQLKIECPQCSCRYAVVGGAYFCPACGNNSAPQLFTLTLDALERTLSAIPILQSAVEDPDIAASTIRNLVEGSLQNSVTAFQRFAEALYEAVRAQDSELPKPRRNAFQNLSEGSELWQLASGKGYESCLSDSERVELHRCFQQRHLLAHRQGIVDQDYISRSGDTSYRVGQRLVVNEATASRCVELVRRLGDGMLAEGY